MNQTVVMRPVLTQPLPAAADLTWRRFNPQPCLRLPVGRGRGRRAGRDGNSRVTVTAPARFSASGRPRPEMVRTARARTLPERGFSLSGAGRRGCVAAAMTTANKVTILRILLIPFFVVEVLYYVQQGREVYRFAALAAFAVAAILDGVDGFIARHFHQRSELGALLDPLADKLLLVSAVVLLSFDHAPRLESLPLWLTGTIIGRDALLLAGWLVIHMTVGKVVVRPRFLGKVATVLQMVAVLWVLLKWHGAWLAALTVAAAVCTGGSGLLYVWDGVRQLSASPSSSPTPQPGGAGPESSGTRQSGA